MQARAATAADLRHHLDALDEAGCVRLAAAEVVDLARARVLGERPEGLDDVGDVDLVADLLALVAEDGVLALPQGDVHEVAHEAVQLDAGVVRAGEAAATEDARPQAEVAPVLLSEHVGCDLGCAEEGVKAAFDRHGLVDALIEARVGVVPPRLQLHQRHAVGVVAVDLVRRHRDEHGFGSVTTARLEQVEGADSVDVEVVERARGGEVVAGLGRGMDHELVAALGEQVLDRLPVTDVDRVVRVVTAPCLEPLPVPRGVALGAEEVGAHVVVDSVDREAQTIEELDRLRADQARAAGHEHLHGRGEPEAVAADTAAEPTGGLAPFGACQTARPMRVAVTMEQCWHRVPGGTARATIDATAAVERTGEIEQVGVAAWHRGPPRPGYAPSIPVRQLLLPRPALYESWHRLRRPRVERATGAVDVIHATGYALPPRSAPLVATVHDLHFLHEPDHFTPQGVRTFSRFLELVRAEASIVVCPSEDARRDCAGAGIAPNRLRVVPWGIRPRALPDGAVERVKHTYALSRPFVLFTGTVEPRKNLRRLFEAVRRLDRPGVDLVLVGPNGWQEDLTPPPHTRRLGFVPAEDRDALYAGAAVVAYPSLREGFGLPVLEAMAQGAPVVTSAGTATAEVSGDAAVLVDPRDVDAIAGALARVLDDEDLAARLRAAGPVRAAEFSWERTARGTIAAYRAATA